MGCRVSKNDSKVHQYDEGTKALSTSNTNHCSNEMETKTKAEYKARLERQTCLAKECPEPEFDLSRCNLKEIPSGVFILCRVLRKEILNLSENQLRSINCNNNNSIGLLSDLSLLHVLDLRFNRIKQLPEEINKLENLRELLISNNQLQRLPQAIKSLQKLELLDVSHNNLQSIDEINCMTNLRIINFSGNSQLRLIPTTVATCNSICDLIFDKETIDWPPIDVLNSGTMNIIHFLATGENTSNAINTNTVQTFKQPEDALISDNVNKISNTLKSNATTNNHRIDKTGYGNEDALLEEIQRRQQQQKQQLLQAVLMQQNETEALVNKLQQKKDNERDLLIKDIIRAEENATLVIENFLTGKSHTESALLEKERIEEERLLEKVHLEHSELRRQEILSTMLDLLHCEENKMLDYQRKRDANSADIVQKEFINSTQLNQLHRNYERNRNEICNRINEDEELQKQALATLIAKSDARSWGLIGQLRIIEMQLAEMTQFEIERKKYCNMEQINELADKRMHLTTILTDLLDQQEKRRKQLCDTLQAMEEQKSNEQQDYWLLQYQRLLDSRPTEIFEKSASSIDSRLCYQFLINGVIHCLPFLQRLLLTKDIFFENLTNHDLKDAGIHDNNDQRLIMKSINEFVKENLDKTHIHSHKTVIIPTAPSVSPPSDDEIAAKTKNSTTKVRDSLPDNGDEQSTGASECVICMENNVRVIFLPCGHMCCCLNCQLKVEICPMCRADIERKIKVIQS